MDFATSGVLVAALHRDAATIGCQAFALRETAKEYVAVVHGHVALPDGSRYCFSTICTVTLKNDFNIFGMCFIIIDVFTVS